MVTFGLTMPNDSHEGHGEIFFSKLSVFWKTFSAMESYENWTSCSIPDGFGTPDLRIRMCDGENLEQRNCTIQGCEFSAQIMAHNI